MKKAIAIIILGLLLSGNAYAGKVKKILHQGDNVIIIKEDRSYKKSEFVNFSNKYCNFFCINSIYRVYFLLLVQRK